MLIKTTAELKTLLPRLMAKLNNNALLPNFDRAEQKYLLPLVGQDLFTEIKTIYDAGTGTDTQKLILKNMQLVAAAQALLDELGTNVATITDAGIQSQQTAAMPRVYGWEFKAFRSALQDAAADAVDVLLQSLWLNQGSLASWTADKSFTQFNSLLIRTGIEFNDVHPLFHPQRTFYAIKSLLMQVQDQVITAALGDDVVKWFIDNYSTTDAAQVRILKSIQASLAFYTVKKSCEHFSVKISDAGFTVVGSGDPESEEAGRTADNTKGSFLQLKMQACDRDGAGYLSRAKKDLVKYAQTVDAPAGLVAALAAGPLSAFDPLKKRDLGNSGRRGIFRM